MGGIRERLEVLTGDRMKAFVSAAVAAEKAASTPQTAKLLADMNKRWVVVLKALKEYDAMLVTVEQKVRATAGKQLDDAAFDQAQAAINAAKGKLRPMAAELAQFEKTVAAIATRFNLTAPKAT